jgi:hypothetical protein
VTTSELEQAVYELFVSKEELLPFWLQLRAHVEAFGPDVRLRVRAPFAEFDRSGSLFVLVEPKAHRRIEIGLHNPGLPFDDRFRDASDWGSRKITHRVTLGEGAQIDDELHTRLHVAYELALEGEPR